MAFEGVFGDNAAQPSAPADMRDTADSLLRQSYPDLPQNQPVDWDQLTNRLLRKIQTRAQQPAAERPSGVKIPDADVPYVVPQIRDADKPYEPGVKTEAVKPEQMPQQPLPTAGQTESRAGMFGAPQTGAVYQPPQAPGWFTGQPLPDVPVAKVRPTEPPAQLPEVPAGQPTPPLQPTGTGTIPLGSWGRAAGQALTSGAANTVEAAGFLNPATAQATGRLSVAARIDRGETVPPMEDIDNYAGMTADQRAAYRADLLKTIKQRPLQGAAKSIESFGQKQFPTTQAERESVGGRVASGIAGMAPAVATTMAGAAIGMPWLGVAGGAAQMGLQSFGQTFNTAYQKALEQASKGEDAARLFDDNVDAATKKAITSKIETKALDAALSASKAEGMVAAAIGSVPLGMVLAPIRQFAPGLAGWAVGKLAQAGANGVTFAAADQAQQYLSSEIAREYYDPNAKYSPDVKEAFASFLTGAGFGVLHPLREPAQPAQQQQAQQQGQAPSAGAAATGAGPQPGTGGAGAGAGGPGAASGGAQPGGSQPGAGTAGAGAGAGQPPPGGGPQPGTGGAGGQPPPGGAQAGPQGGAQQARGPRPNPADVDATWTGVSANARGAMQRIMAEMGYSADDIRYTTLDDAKEIIRLQNILRTYHGDTSWKRPGMSLADLQEAVRQANEQATRDGHYAGNAETAHEEPSPKGAPEQPQQQAAGGPSATGAKEQPQGTGTREDPIHAQTADDVARAAAQADQEHTPAQGEANNVKRGHMVWTGLDVTIEAPPGGVRRGQAPDGTPFETQFAPDTAYGYIRGVPVAADGQAPDVYIGPNPQAPQAYVIDELDPVTRAYRQSKVLAGYDTKEQALAAYLATSSKSPEQIGGLRAFTPEQVAQLARNGDLSRPVTGNIPIPPQRAAEQPAAPPPTPPEQPGQGGALRAQGGGAPIEAIRDHAAVENALRSEGIDPRNVLPVTIAHAAELAAHHGFDPLDAWQLAARRYFIDHGVLSMDDVRRLDGDAVAHALVASSPGVERGVPGEARGAAAGGEAPAPSEAAAAHGARHGEAGPAEAGGVTAGGRAAEIRPAEAAEPGAAAGSPVAEHAAPGPVAHPGGEATGRGGTERGAAAGRRHAGTEDHVAGGGPAAPRETAEGTAPVGHEAAAPAGHEGAAAPETGRAKADEGHGPERARTAEGARTKTGEGHAGRAAAAEDAGAAVEPKDILEAAALGAKDHEAGRPPRRDLGDLQVAYDASYRRGAREATVQERARVLDEQAAAAALARTKDQAQIKSEETRHGVPRPVHHGDEGAGTEAVQPAAEVGAVRGARRGEGEGGGPPVPGTHEGRPEDAERISERPLGEGGAGAGVRDTDRLPEREPPANEPGKGRAGSPAGQPDARVRGENYRITPGSLGENRGWKQKARDNIRAIELLRHIEAEDRPATKEEQAALARYVGWGGISGAFPNTEGKFSSGYEEIGDQLKGLLKSADYAAARRSIQYAHYTSEAVTRAMWDAARRLGFAEGEVFEPGMGIGNFAGMMPPDIAAKTRYVGLEVDPTTARIARLLYPRYGVRQGDFTRAPLPNDHFDLAIGNPPFADIVIRSDPRYADNGFFLHDYFFAKSLDGVRPGGLVAFISSAGTLNKADASAREYLAARANLVGAIRLPSMAFRANAGTDVTTDIIFLRKLLPNEGLGDQSWTETSEVTLPNKEGEPTKGLVNRYFVDHPEMVLGKEGFFDKLYQGRYAVHAPEGFDLPAELAKAVARLPENVMGAWETPADRAEADFGTAERKEGSFYVDDKGRLMQVEAGVGKPVQGRGAGVSGGKTPDEVAKIRGLIPIRDALRSVFEADLNGDSGNAATARTRLNKHYDDFVDKFGPINKATFSYRRPSRVEAEGARAEAREEARYAGQEFREGSFDPSELIAKKASLAEIARARDEARQAALAKGQPWDEGSFDPAEMADNAAEKRPNIDPFMSDPESYRLRSIENYDDATGKASKGLIFSENVLSKEKTPEIKSVDDAVLHVLNRMGRLDIPETARLAGKSESETIEALGDRVYRLPDTRDGWITRDEYLSGDVKTKLAEAKRAVEGDPSLKRNVEALEAAQPAPRPPSQIGLKLGSPWVPEDVVAEFGRELGLESIKVKYVPPLAQWLVEGDQHSVASTSTWGTSRRAAPYLISDALNQQTPKIYDTERDPGGGKREVLNVEATQAAQEMVERLRQRFVDWAWGDTDRADKLAALYNERHNRMVAREYNGDYLTTPGVAKTWQWRPHQTRVVARIIQSGNTYMAHSVGAGKTSAMIGAGMEMRRLGLARKPMYVVPNHMLAQFTKEFYQQYPTARIMIADERQFHTDRRRQFVSDVSTNDLDGVIITHSAFGKIPLSDEFHEKLIHDEVDKFRDALDSIPKSQETRITRKRIEKQIERLEQRLAGREGRDKDQTFTFEQTGVDFLFVDEAHLFRKLDFATQMSGLKGVSPEGSKMAWDLYAKSLYLDEQWPGRSLVLASGTPITNTMAELYSVQRYLQRNELAKQGLDRFDAWAGMYGQSATALEQNAAGGYQPVTRFRKFVNAADLSTMVRQVMDIVTGKQLSQYVVRPSLRGGERTMNLAEKSDALEAYQHDLAARMDAIQKRKRPPRKGDDIMLAVINDGRHAAIDMRLVRPQVQVDTPSKLDQLVNNVHRIWSETKKQPFHAAEKGTYGKKPVSSGPATQLIFANLGLSGTRGFSVPDYIRAELTRRGVPKSEVAYIYDYPSHADKQRLFNDMNAGKVRILIGSTAKMATGVNVQKRLYAVHNLDPLWFPSDDEQRNGRIIRQGNMNPVVEIHDYATKGTYDSSMWKMMANKAGFIRDFFEGNPSLVDMDDLGEASQYEQAAAITTSDPRLMQLTDLQQDLEKAQRRWAAFDAEQHALRAKVSSARSDVKEFATRIADLRKDIAKREDTTGDAFAGHIGGKRYDKRAEFGEALAKRVTDLMEAENVGKRFRIADVGGFQVEAQIYQWRDESVHADTQIPLHGGYKRNFNLSTSPVWTARAIEEVLHSFEGSISQYEEGVAKAEKFIADAAEKVKEKFQGEGQINELRAKIAALQTEMSGENRPVETDPDSVVSLEDLEHFGPEWPEEWNAGAPYMPDRAAAEPKLYSAPRPTPIQQPRAEALDTTLPLKSDKASIGKRQRLEEALNDALRHMLGPNAPRLELPDRIEPNGPGGWGLVSIGEHGYTGAYTPAQRLAASVIEIALGHPNFERSPNYAFSTFFHEIVHAFHDHAMTPEEMALMNREMPRMRARVQKYRGFTDEEAASLDEREVIATHGEAYATERALGGTGAGTHIGLRRFYERILQFLRDVANTLRRAFGYSKPEDIWSDLYEGKMAGRPDLKTGREFASREPVLPGEEGRVAEPTFGAAARAEGEGGKLYDVGRGPATSAAGTASRRWIPEKVEVAADHLMDLGGAIRDAITPMAGGRPEGRRAAKDYANEARAIDYDLDHEIHDITKKWTPEQRREMWDRANEEGEAINEGRPVAPGTGLSELDPEQQAYVRKLVLDEAPRVWQAMKNVGMSDGDGLKFWVPRIAVMMSETGHYSKAQPSGEGGTYGDVGRGFTTTAGSAKRRKYKTAAETEAAMKAKFGEGAQLARDIAAVPLALAKLKKAVAARVLINKIKALSKEYGADLVHEGASPGPQFFTLDHPAFFSTRPQLKKMPDGTWSIAKHEDGTPAFERIPIFIHKDLKAPLLAVLGRDTGKVYRALMTLRAKVMVGVMYSPAIHNIVEWSRAFPTHPGQMLTLRLYHIGNAAKNDRNTMREFIRGGMVPIGRRFVLSQEMSSIMEAPQLAAGRSITAHAASYLPGLFDPRAAEKTKQAVDSMGDFWHNTLLWDRVGDLQVGLAVETRDDMLRRGYSREAAVLVGAHIANRYAGSLPLESMSTWARVAANVIYFSRTFTFGNLGAIKDAVTGLPRDVQAQLLRLGEDEMKRARNYARRKALTSVGLDYALAQITNTIFASAVAMMGGAHLGATLAGGVAGTIGGSFIRRGMPGHGIATVLTALLGGAAAYGVAQMLSPSTGWSTLEKEAEGYVNRLQKLIKRVESDPTYPLRHPFEAVQSLSKTAENEAGKRDKILVGHQADGTAIYARNPLGKMSEDQLGLFWDPVAWQLRKTGVFAKPLAQAIANDHLYPNEVRKTPVFDKTDDASAIKNIARFFELYLEALLPNEAIRSGVAALTGKDLPSLLPGTTRTQNDTWVNVGKVVDPFLGVTVSKGYPGGEKAAEKHHEREQRELRRTFEYAAPRDSEEGLQKWVKRERESVLSDETLSGPERAERLREIQSAAKAARKYMNRPARGTPDYTSPTPHYTPGVFNRSGTYTPPAAPASPPRPVPTAPPPAASGAVMGRMSPFGAYSP